MRNLFARFTLGYTRAKDSDIILDENITRAFTILNTGETLHGIKTERVLQNRNPLP